MSQQTNLDPIDEPAPEKKQVSEKQYNHLKRAREIKQTKKELKDKQIQFHLDQLKGIYTQLDTMNTQMGSLINKCNSFMIEASGGGMKRKREEDEVEVKKEEPLPKKTEPSKDVAPPATNSVDETYEVDHSSLMAGVGKFVGGILAMAALYGWRNYTSENKHPSTYLYSNLNQ
jgi:hypothetical protein